MPFARPRLQLRTPIARGVCFCLFPLPSNAGFYASYSYEKVSHLYSNRIPIQYLLKYSNNCARLRNHARATIPPRPTPAHTTPSLRESLGTLRLCGQSFFCSFLATRHCFCFSAKSNHSHTYAKDRRWGSLVYITIQLRQTSHIVGAPPFSTGRTPLSCYPNSALGFLVKMHLSGPS